MRVLVVEDNDDIREALRVGLRRESIAVDTAGDGHEAITRLDEVDYDVIVLDRDLPGPSGDEIAQNLAEAASATRILMLTAADRLEDKETGFQHGADDYLTKPFEFRELLMRVRALGRRAMRPAPVRYTVADLVVDPFRQSVERAGERLELTRKQFAVLEVLLSADGGVVSQEELLARAWDENADPFSNPVRVTISLLRRRLGSPDLIETVPGAGYRVRAVGVDHDR